MKKILFVINTMGQAGAEMAMLALMKQLDRTQFDIYLYVLMGQGEMIYHVPDNVKCLNSRYCDTSVLAKEGRKKMVETVIRSSLNRGAGFKLIPHMAVNLGRMIKKKRVQTDKLLWRVLSDGAQVFETEFDIAVAYLEGGSAYYVADHVKAKKKVGFIHIDYEMSGYTRRLDKDCYLKFDKIFAVSDEVRESFIRAYPEIKENVMVFHNFLDIENIKERSMDDGGFDDDYDGIRILTVGRITKQKAYDVAVLAMKELKDIGCRARWYVVGDGPLRGQIQQLINENGLQEEFILLGAKKNPYPFFRQADIYAHCTRFEGKSIAIQEARVLGCPIIASDCNGNREQIINGEDGILCELTPKAIADGIKGLIDDEALRDKFSKASFEKKINHEEDLLMLTDL